MQPRQPTKSRSLLIADEEPAVRTLIAESVRSLELDILQAGSGDEAWAMIQDLDPEILVLEAELPAINGLMLCQRVRSRTSKTDVQIVMTLASVDREARITAYECGADSIMSKPCHPREIRAQIENATRLYSFRRVEEERRNLEIAFANLAKTNAMVIEGWTRALDLRDKESEGHSIRVTNLTVQLAERFGCVEPELTDIRYGALLHDIGKIGIPDRILHKEGALTDDERREMQRHPEYAVKMLQGLDHLKSAVAIPRCHHEKWDGTGYPRGMQGEDIPFSARLFSVVDVYDALKSERPYKPAWSDEAVFAELRSLSGTHFDPSIVDVFIDMMQKRDQSVA